VQGVGFRAWTARRAQALGLTGWVRNEADGAVAVLVAGPPEAVARMLADLREGPPSARVARVEERPAAPPPDGGFAVLR
jgi:acylphosphatase